jgi:hypothetical protein
MNRNMETIVRQYPEQYFWMHDRWKQYTFKGELSPEAKLAASIEWLCQRMTESQTIERGSPSARGFLPIAEFLSTGDALWKRSMRTTPGALQPGNSG